MRHIEVERARSSLLDEILVRPKYTKIKIPGGVIAHIQV